MKITKLLNGGKLYEYAHAEKHWFLNGKRHREDGPAIVYANGIKIWYIDDQLMPCSTEEEFERLLKLKAFW
jgi:hypothetical protein